MDRILDDFKELLLFLLSDNCGVLYEKMSIYMEMLEIKLQGISLKYYSQITIKREEGNRKGKGNEGMGRREEKEGWEEGRK